MKNITLKLIDPAQLVALLGNEGHKALCDDRRKSEWSEAVLKKSLALPQSVTVREFSVTKTGHLWLLLETPE